MKKMKIGLLPKIVIAIALGIVCGLFFPDWEVVATYRFAGVWIYSVFRVLYLFCL